MLEAQFLKLETSFIPNLGTQSPKYSTCLGQMLNNIVVNMNIVRQCAAQIGEIVNHIQSCSLMVTLGEVYTFPGAGCHITCLLQANRQTIFLTLRRQFIHDFSMVILAVGIQSSNQQSCFGLCVQPFQIGQVVISTKVDACLFVSKGLQQQVVQ